MNRHVVYGGSTVNTYERETDTFLESFSLQCVAYKDIIKVMWCPYKPQIDSLIATMETNNNLHAITNISSLKYHNVLH